MGTPARRTSTIVIDAGVLEARRKPAQRPSVAPKPRTLHRPAIRLSGRREKAAPRTSTPVVVPTEAVTPDMVVDVHDSRLSHVQHLRHSCDAVMLFAHGNALTGVGGVWGLSNLVKLDLATNAIVALPDAGLWARLPSLAVLYLQGNAIAAMDDVLSLAACPSLLHLRLDGNPVALTPGYRRATVQQLKHLMALDAHLVVGAERCTDATVEAALDAAEAGGDVAGNHVVTLLRGHAVMPLSPAVAVSRPQFQVGAAPKAHLAALASELHALQQASGQADTRWRLVAKSLVGPAAPPAARHAAATRIQAVARRFLWRASSRAGLEAWVAATCPYLLLSAPRGSQRTKAIVVQRKWRHFCRKRVENRAAGRIQRAMRLWGAIVQHRTILWTARRTTSILFPASHVDLVRRAARQSATWPRWEADARHFAATGAVGCKPLMELHLEAPSDSHAVTVRFSSPVVPPLHVPEATLDAWLDAAVRPAGAAALRWPSAQTPGVWRRHRLRACSYTSPNAGLSNLRARFSVVVSRLAALRRRRGSPAWAANMAARFARQDCPAAPVPDGNRMYVFTAPSVAFLVRVVARLHMLSAAKVCVFPGVVDAGIAATMMQSVWRAHVSRQSARPGLTVQLLQARAVVCIQRWHRSRRMHWRLAMLAGVSRTVASISSATLYMEASALIGLQGNAVGGGVMPPRTVSGDPSRPWSRPYAPEHDVLVTFSETSKAALLVRPHAPPTAWAARRVGLPVWLGVAVKWVRDDDARRGGSPPPAGAAADSLEAAVAAVPLLSSGAEVRVFPVEAVGHTTRPLRQAYTQFRLPEWTTRGVGLVELTFPTVHEARVRAALLAACTWYPTLGCGAQLMTLEQLWDAWRTLDSIPVRGSPTHRSPRVSTRGDFLLPTPWAIKFGMLAPTVPLSAFTSMITPHASVTEESSGSLAGAAAASARRSPSLSPVTTARRPGAGGVTPLHCRTIDGMGEFRVVEGPDGVPPPVPKLGLPPVAAPPQVPASAPRWGSSTARVHTRAPQPVNRGGGGARRRPHSSYGRAPPPPTAPPLAATEPELPPEARTVLASARDQFEEDLRHQAATVTREARRSLKESNRMNRALLMQEVVERGYVDRNVLAMQREAAEAAEARAVAAAKATHTRRNAAAKTKRRHRALGQRFAAAALAANRRTKERRPAVDDSVRRTTAGIRANRDALHDKLIRWHTERLYRVRQAAMEDEDNLRLALECAELDRRQDAADAVARVKAPASLAYPAQPTSAAAMSAAPRTRRRRARLSTGVFVESSLASPSTLGDESVPLQSPRDDVPLPVPKVKPSHVARVLRRGVSPLEVPEAGLPPRRTIPPPAHAVWKRESPRLRKSSQPRIAQRRLSSPSVTRAYAAPWTADGGDDLGFPSLMGESLSGLGEDSKGAL